MNIRRGSSIQPRVEESDTGSNVFQKEAWDVERGLLCQDLLVVVVESLPNLVPQRRLDAPAPPAKSNQNYIQTEFDSNQGRRLDALALQFLR